MKHIFDVEIAQKYGIYAAILLESLGYWIKRNEANDKNFFDGTYWTYNSRRAYRELFPYMSERNINTAFEKLINDGLIITSNYNKSAYDRTLWYALTEKGKSILRFDIIDNDKTENANSQNDKPIPSDTDIGNTSENNLPPIAPNGGASKAEECFEQFWSAYPRKVNKQGAKKAFLRIPKLLSQFTQIMAGLENQKRSKQWKKDNGVFIPHPTTWINQERWKEYTETKKDDILDNIF